MGSSPTAVIVSVMLILLPVVVSLVIGYLRHCNRLSKAGESRSASQFRGSAATELCELPSCRNTYTWEANTPITPDMLEASAKYAKSKPDGFSAVIASMSKTAT